MSARTFAVAALGLVAVGIALAALLLSSHALGAVPEACEADSPRAALINHLAAELAARSPRPCRP